MDWLAQFNQLSSSCVRFIDSVLFWLIHCRWSTINSINRKQRKMTSSGRKTGRVFLHIGNSKIFDDGKGHSYDIGGRQHYWCEQRWLWRSECQPSHWWYCRARGSLSSCLRYAVSLRRLVKLVYRPLCFSWNWPWAVSCTVWEHSGFQNPVYPLSGFKGSPWKLTVRPLRVS